MFNNFYLIIRIVIAILTFITSGFMIFLILRYVVFTTYAIEHLSNSIELILVDRNSAFVSSTPINPIANIGNMISRVSSPDSVDIANIVSSISSNIAFESGIINTLHDSPVPSSNMVLESTNIVYNTTTSLINHSMINPDLNNSAHSVNNSIFISNTTNNSSMISPDLNTSTEVPVHRRVVIAYIIGFGIFVGINSIVGFYLFLATPCC